MYGDLESFEGAAGLIFDALDDVLTGFFAFFLLSLELVFLTKKLTHSLQI